MDKKIYVKEIACCGVCPFLFNGDKCSFSIDDDGHFKTIENLSELPDWCLLEDAEKDHG